MDNIVIVREGYALFVFHYIERLLNQCKILVSSYHGDAIGDKFYLLDRNHNNLAC